LALAVCDPLEQVLQPHLMAVTRFAPAQFDEISEQISYRFNDVGLLVRALTHASTQKHKGDYQRLEFLGDRVLGLAIAEYLFRTFPDLSEGDLSAALSVLVRGESCAQAAEALGLSELMRLGSSEKAKGLNFNRTLLGDVMEALLGAIYLDGGLEAAREFVLRNWEPQLAHPASLAKDAKTFLQEWALARALPIPHYRVVSRAGPEHEPVFVVAVEIKGKAAAEGMAKSKRAAEQQAAEQFLKREGIRS
jgi:ribonuclease III